MVCEVKGELSGGAVWRGAVWGELSGGGGLSGGSCLGGGGCLGGAVWGSCLEGGCLGGGGGGRELSVILQ